MELSFTVSHHTGYIGSQAWLLLSPHTHGHTACLCPSSLLLVFFFPCSFPGEFFRQLFFLLFSTHMPTHAFSLAKVTGHTHTHTHIFHYMLLGYSTVLPCHAPVMFCPSSTRVAQSVEIWRFRAPMPPFSFICLCFLFARVRVRARALCCLISFAPFRDDYREAPCPAVSEEIERRKSSVRERFPI